MGHNDPLRSGREKGGVSRDERREYASTGRVWENTTLPPIIHYSAGYHRRYSAWYGLSPYDDGIPRAAAAAWPELVTRSVTGIAV